ncbi:MAG: caa(3)-type oxidase, subunit [Acidobacteria bacterium]|nr:caa(3)-type oxidase, subunit [Acidobacteriota bacterium]
MHSDPESVRKSVRSYLTVFVLLMIFTVITVAVSRLHFGVPVAIGVALVIASIKGSMVAGVFMHLSYERKWIYGSLILTALGFLILMTVPSLTIRDNIGTPIHVAAPSAEHARH